MKDHPVIGRDPKLTIALINALRDRHAKMLRRRVRWLKIKLAFYIAIHPFRVAKFRITNTP